jgi:hypothetical protein
MSYLTLSNKIQDTTQGIAHLYKANRGALFFKFDNGDLVKSVMKT